MSQTSHEIGRTSVRIIAAITMAAVLGLAAIAGVVLWITQEFNRSAQAATKRVIEVNFEDIQRSLANTTESYAHWNMMYDAVTLGRRTLINADVGYLVHQRDIFDFVALTDHDGTIRHAFLDHDPAAGPEQFPFHMRDEVARAVRATGAPWSATVTGIYRVGDRFAIVAGSAVTPTRGLKETSAPPPIMITGRYLDPLQVPAAQDLLAERGLVLVLGDIVPQPDRNFLRLDNADGRTVGALIWRPVKPGYDVLSSSAPIIALACIVLMLSGLFVLKASERLRHALKKESDVARTDPLTGLPNRAGLEAYLHTDPVKQALKTGQVAVLYLDLNGFKLLNDAEGHAHGDAALRITAARLMRSLRESDLVARVGGDEFVCIITDPNPANAARIIIDRIKTNTERPIQANGTGYILSPAIGLAVATPGDIWASLVTRADTNMYTAKREAGDARLDIRTTVHTDIGPSARRIRDSANAA